MNPSECLLSCVTCPLVLLAHWTSGFQLQLSNNSVFISNKSVSYSNSLDKLNKCNSETWVALKTMYLITIVSLNNT